MGLAQFIAKVLRRFVWRWNAGDRTAARQAGDYGEREAARFLKSRGYKILARQWKADCGCEIDLLARDGDTLVFVEVKTRSSEKFGHPADAVDSEKQRRVARAAREYLRRLGRSDVYYRFDVVEVIGGAGGKRPECRLIPGAFSPDRSRDR